MLPRSPAAAPLLLPTRLYIIPRMRHALPEPHRTDNVHDELFVKVFAVARLTIDAGWNAQHVCSGYWRLYCNDAPGAAVLLADGTPYPLVAHRVHLIPAWVRFSCRNRRRVRHRFVHFDLIGVPAATVQHLFTKPLTLPRDATLERLAATLGDPAPAGVAICRAKSVVYSALGRVLEQIPGTGLDQLPAAGPVAPAVRHIDDHLGDALRVPDLARLCHFSPDHFGRLFRQRVGRSPAQYVIERRLAAASQALAFTDDSMELIAERLGFSSRYHLTRLFSRRMGTAPAAYRRRARV